MHTVSEKVSQYSTLMKNGFLAREQKRLEKDIFSSPSESFDDLDLKARLAQEILDNETFPVFGFTRDKILKNLINDIQVVYAREKSKFDGSYDPEAPFNYYTLFYPGQ